MLWTGDRQQFANLKFCKDFIFFIGNDENGFKIEMETALERRMLSLNFVRVRNPASYLSERGIKKCGSGGGGECRRCRENRPSAADGKFSPDETCYVHYALQYSHGRVDVDGYHISVA